MGHLVTACMFLMTLIALSGGQTCGSNLLGQCYFTGAGTIAAGRSDNQYFAIGGLFDIHEKGTDSFCGTDISEEGMLNLLAFYWGINYFANSILKGKPMSVGAIAFDSCMRPDKTVENMLSFAQCKVQVQGLGQQNVVAYVGPYSNKDTARTGMLAQELKIPIISPQASSLDLDTSHQKTLLRKRPSIMYDMKAIAGFVKALGHDFLMVVYSDSKHWTSAYQELKSNIDGLCNNFAHSLSEDASDSTIDELATQLKARSSAKYVALLMSHELAESVMKKANNVDLIFILSSEIGQNKKSVRNRAIIVEPALPPQGYMNEFKNFINTVRSNASHNANLGRTDLTNPWLEEFIRQGRVVPDMDAVPSPVQMTVWRTIESVETIIDGLNIGISDSCGTVNYQFCDEIRNLQGHEDKIYGFIKGDTFGDDGQLKAKNVEYNYYIYLNSNDQFKKIGTFNGEDSKTEITENLNDLSLYGHGFSGSVCPLNFALECCPPPTTPEPKTDPPTTPVTREPATQEPGDVVMVMYPKGKEITGAFSLKDRSDDDYGTRFDIDQKWIIALGVLSGLGVVCVLVFEVFILYKMIGRHMDNKWRTMWLGQLLLFGILLSYLVCIAYIWIPTKATCGITRFGVGVAYAICFAVLLVKLMVILTSKSSDVLLPGDVESPNYLKGVYQFLMFTFAVGIQIVINVQWLITVPPEAIQVKSSTGMVWICNHYTWNTDQDMINMDDFVRTNFENHLLSLTYIMVMILVITILSLNAHGIITNHRESVFIGIASGFSIPLWLAWGLVGGLNKDKDYGHEFGDACVAFGLFLTATLILFSMFLPKVRQLVNMGMEGIYLEDDRDTIYGGGSVIMAPPSYRSKGAPSSIIYVNNQGIYSEPVVVGNGDPMATHLKHPGSVYSAPPVALRKSDSTYGGSRVLRVTDDLKGRHPSTKPRKPVSEMGYGNSGRPRSLKGTLPRSRPSSDLGAL